MDNRVLARINNITFSLLFLVAGFLALGTNTVQAQVTNTISGMVSLPAGDVAPAGGLDIYINAYDQNYGADSGFAFAFIAAGASSAAYSLTVPPDTSAQWQVSYSCYSCSPYVGSGYYASGAAGTTTWDSSLATLLTGGADHTGINLSLITGNTISGTVSLPVGDVAPAGGLNININAEDRNYGGGYGSDSEQNRAG